MDIETLKAIIIEGQELLDELEPIARDTELEDQARYVFVGIRQSGKSYMLYLRALHLIALGHSKREMLFINFDDERLIGMKAENLDYILKAYSSMFELKPILFLDEIQNVEGWEHFARRLANQKYMVYITGSNAKMLSRDIASTLGARYIELSVFPFSFHEFLRAKKIGIEKGWQYGKRKGEVERALSEYFTWGGFPELILFKNKRHWLNELYEKIILGDIIARNKIKNETALRLAVRRLAENIKTPTSYNRLANIVKGTDVSTNVASIAEYVGYCTDACLLFSLENYASKFVERMTVRKHYFMDNGLLNIFLTDSETSLMENLCALTLYRNATSHSEEKVYFYNKEVEMDFYIPSQKKGIQAAFSVSDPNTLELEVKALTKFHRLYGLNEAEIVTYSESRTIEIEGLTIKIRPLAEWLLEFDY